MVCPTPHRNLRNLGSDLDLLQNFFHSQYLRNGLTHAWLIIAHNEFGILQRLITALDAPQCDFFIHIDRKVKNLPELTVAAGRPYMLKDRVDVRWGSVSQIRCELALFQAAEEHGSYDFYHVISGTTLPLKPFPQIDEYFLRHAGKSILSGLCRDTAYQETLKMRRYNLFLRNYGSANAVKRKVSQYMWKSAIAAQRLLGIQANRGKSFYKASNWLSLTEEAVQYLLSSKKEILKTYRWSFCGDEFFVPSELMASPLCDKILNSDQYLYREIKRSTATSYCLNELPRLAASGCLFARKFSER